MLNQIRRVLSVMIIMALLLGSGLPFGGQPAAAADGEGQDLPPLELREKGNPKLDSQLNQLVSAETSRKAASFAQESNIELVDGNVRVIIESLPDQIDAAVKAVDALGVVETSYRNLLQVVVPIPQLTALADAPSIRLVRLPWYPLPAVISEGVALVNADEWQTASYNGTGVKVAILDVGFTGYADLLGTELPNTVTTASFYAGSDIEGYSSHGTACAEIVYDIAPDADFYLVNFGTDVEMGTAVDWLIDTAEVDVISCSIVWPIGGPGDGTGIICEMVDDARAAGILWSQAMGNYAEEHWQGDFVDTVSDNWCEFSGTDEGNTISVSSGEWITVALKWDDTWGESANDYDLLLYDNADPPNLVAWSGWIQDGDDDPIEWFTIYSSDYTGLCHIAIFNWSATETVNFHLYSYYHDLEYPVASSSLAVPADSANATAVGAVPWDNPTTLELFSSQGPTEDNRIKPDLVAPDGVSTATYGASAFDGTSASAPHVAGAAALVKERYPSYTPAQIQAFLEERAVELGAGGKDNLFGSGRLDLGSSGIIEVTTNAADNITTDSAILHGSLDSLGDYSPVNVSFEWGTEPGVYSDNTTPEAMTSIGAFSANLTSLSSDTTYYFRAKAIGSVTVYGDELSFTTLKVSPAVTTNAADNVTSDSATLNGNLTNLGDYSPVNVSFEWGTEPEVYSDNTTPEAMTTTGNFTADLSGLSSDTTYYFRAKATGSVTVYGDELSFTTLKASPAVTTNAADNITSDSATLHGNLTSLGDYSPVNVSFEWGTEPGVYSDNTTPEAMTSIGAFSADLSSLSPSTTYYFRAKATGSVTVYGNELSFTTLKALVSANITPENPTIALGRTQQFTATGTYSDNSTDNITGTVTWTSDNVSVATIDAAGLAQSLAEGQTTITAASGNVSDNTTLTVGPKELDAIDITPDNPTIALGRTQQFTAIGTYSDNTTPDITDNVTWASDNTTVATIGGNTGLAKSLAEGQTTITATLDAISDNTTLTIGPKVLDAIAVTPPNPSIAAGGTQQFTATGTYSDNSTDNMTSSATWSSSNTTVARINAAGLATSYALGTANITATSGNVSGNATLTVGPAVLDSVTITPVDPTITFVSGAGNQPTLQFTATSSKSDGSTSDNTTTATWTSDNTTVVEIKTAGEDNSGLATVKAAGTANITASLGSVSDNITLTVLPDTVAPVVTLTSPTEGQVLSDNTTTVSGIIDDLSATANVTVNGGTPTALTLGASGNFSQSITLNTDSNTVLVTAVDGSGNTGTSGTITVVVNPNKPGIVITQPLAGIVTDNSSLTVAGTVSGNVTSANLILNGGSQSVSVASGNFSANVTLAEGINILVVNAYPSDHGGESNYLGTSGVRMVTLDTTAPVVIISCPVSVCVVSTPGCKVSGTIDDPGVSTANLTLNGASQSIPVVGGTFSQNITLVSGNNTITVTATDEVGNTSSADAVTILCDNTKPEVRIISPANRLVTDNASQVVTGTVNDPTITTATLYVNGTPQTISVAPDGSFSENVTLAAGANTLEVRASDNATPTNTGTSGVVNVTLDNTAPTITIGLSDPTDSITITVTSNEALAAAPTASVNSTVTMTQMDVNKWSGTYGCAASPIAVGSCTVTVNGTDKAGNTTTRTATFCKETVTISENATATVQTATTTLEIQTTANVTNAAVSVTQHLDNPSGNVGNPEGAEKAAGAFVEIVVSPELRDNLEQIYITVDYDQSELPADTDESTLRLYLWDVSSGTWQAVPDSGVNTTEHYIYGTVTHLSKYGGFGTAAAPPPAPPPRGGGAGGGGGAAGVTPLLEFMSQEGRFTEDVTCKSEDKNVELFIPKNTIGKNRVGSLLYSISIKGMEEPPDPPVDSEGVGLVYNIGPNGAYFDPPIDLTIKYDESKIPDGVAEKNLVVAIFDSSTSQWVEMESTVDPPNDAIKAKVAHFTAFTILAPTRPASFTVADLSIIPKEADLGESVSVSVVVTNTGDLTGSYEVTLSIDNIVAETKVVALDGGDSKRTSFSVTPNTAGEHIVNIGRLLGTYEVKAPEAPAAFTTSDLTISPTEVDIGESVTIGVLVSNTGDLPGSHEVTLKIDDVAVATEDVALAGDDSQTVTFTTTKDVGGTYTVSVNGLSGTFTVKAVEALIPAAAKPINWGLFGGIIVGCVAVGLLAYFFVWRKRGTLRSILRIVTSRRGS